eukprot:gene7939-1153_t
MDTEDVIYRPRRVMKQGGETLRQLRREKLQAWLEETMDRRKAEDEAVMALAGPNGMAS